MALKLNDLRLATLEGCDNPACGHKHTTQLFIRARCHPRAATWTRFELTTRSLVISCSVCGGVVTEVEVAE